MIFPRCSHDIPNKYTTMVFPICSRIGHILCLEIWQHQKPSLFQKSASVSQVVDQRLAADQESRLCHRLCTRLSTMKKWGGLLITNHVPLWHGPLSANYECNWSGIGMRFLSVAHRLLSSQGRNYISPGTHSATPFCYCDLSITHCFPASFFKPLLWSDWHQLRKWT